MPAEHTERLRLRYKADDLFDLVSDVRAYPTFINPISAMRVLRDEVKAGQGSLDAEVRIRFKLVRERFSTRVTLDKAQRSIKVDYLEGPFHELHNQWVFRALDDGSTLADFWIRYAFTNPVLQFLLDNNRSRAIRYLIKTFQAEAARRYDQVGEVEYDFADLK